MATVIVVVAPILIWNPARFLEGTVLFLSRRVEHPYPIRAHGGYGLHVLLAFPGWWDLFDALTSGPFGALRPLADELKIRSKLQYFPFWVLQLIFAVPILILALWRQVGRNTL